MGEFRNFNFATVGDIKNLKKELDNGFDVNAKCKYGHSLMHYANTTSREGVCHLLLDYGFDVYSIERNGTFTFCEIVQRNRYDVMERMLKLGVNPNTTLTINSSFTLIESVIDMYNPFSALLLIQYGANIEFNIKDKTLFEHAYDCYERHLICKEGWFDLLCEIVKHKKEYNENEQKIYQKIKLRALFK